MNEYNGVHGAYHWQIVGNTLRIFSAKPSIGLLATFERVAAINSEQAQWSAQGKIDLNLPMLRECETAKAGGAVGGT